MNLNLKFLQSSDPASAKNKKMMLMMPLLIIVFVFVLTRAFRQPASSSASIQNPTQDKTTLENSEQKTAWQMPEVYPDNLRDPMQPVTIVAGSGDSGNIAITGIIYSYDRPAIVINETIMHQGDKIAGATIVKINRRNVEFKLKDKTWTQEVQQ